MFEHLTDASSLLKRKGERERIDIMDEVEINRTKCFETINFIANALRDPKSQISKRTVEELKYNDSVNLTRYSFDVGTRENTVFRDLYTYCSGFNKSSVDEILETSITNPDINFKFSHYSSCIGLEVSPKNKS